MSDDPSDRPASRPRSDNGDPPEDDEPDGTGDEGVSGGRTEANEPGEPGGSEEREESTESEDLEALRRRVEEEYDFEDFGPSDMAAMSAEEWEVAFDDDSWVTGEDLLDRVEADLRSRVAGRDVFAVVERVGGPDPRLVAYSDEGYAIVHADGSIEGRGTVLRDVKPSLALASMPEYDPPEPPEGGGLPRPEEVPEADGGLGNLMLQFLAAVLLLSGVVLLGAAVLGDLGDAALIAVVVGLGFLVAAIVLGVVVANARLSARYRAREYRDRLRAAGVDADDRPEFLPIDDREFDD